MKRKTVHDRRKFAKYFPKDYTFPIIDFLSACPYVISELKQKTRKRELCQWRQVYFFYQWMRGSTVASVGAEFGKDHTTILYTLDIIMNSLLGFDEMILDKINKTLEIHEIVYSPNEDHSMNEVVSLRMLESKIISKLR